MVRLGCCATTPKKEGIMKKLASSWIIQSLLTKYKARFHGPKDFKQYSKRDLKSVERKLLKYVLEQPRMEIEKGTLLNLDADSLYKIGI